MSLRLQVWGDEQGMASEEPDAEEPHIEPEDKVAHRAQETLRVQAHS